MYFARRGHWFRQAAAGDLRIYRDGDARAQLIRVAEPILDTWKEFVQGTNYFADILPGDRDHLLATRQIAEQCGNPDPCHRQ